jgi:hypothetical protein
MQDGILQLVQLIQFRGNGTYETAIINKFIGHDAILDKISRNAYELMGFDTTPLTQVKEQDLFTIKTRYPILFAFFLEIYLFFEMHPLSQKHHCSRVNW